jgi:hypothetical protein
VRVSLHLETDSKESGLLPTPGRADVAGKAANAVPGVGGEGLRDGRGNGVVYLNSVLYPLTNNLRLRWFPNESRG